MSGMLLKFFVDACQVHVLDKMVVLSRPCYSCEVLAASQLSLG
jgi:hypothetical protein